MKNITYEKAQEIRERSRLAEYKSFQALSEMYKVRPGIIWRIVKGKIYKSPTSNAVYSEDEVKAARARQKAYYTALLRKTEQTYAQNKAYYTARLRDIEKREAQAKTPKEITIDTTAPLEEIITGRGRR